MGILKVCLGVSFINSFFCTKLGASCQITSFPPVLGIRQMDTNISVETDSRYLNKLIRYLYFFFFKLDSTHCFALCHCCMTFHLAQGLFLARDYQSIFQWDCHCSWTRNRITARLCWNKEDTLNKWEIINLDQPKLVLVINVGFFKYNIPYLHLQETNHIWLNNSLLIYSWVHG